jgi:hypothetical protein
MGFKTGYSEQNKGKEWVLFTHGSSTSRRGRTSRRSVLRKFMSSREASQYIIKRESYQDESVFMARAKPLPNTK